MKCNKCGHESAEKFTCCPHCNAAVSENAAANAVLAALQDKLFLVLCILMSAATIFSISAGNLPLPDILICVFLWLTYAKAKKGVADAEQLRSVSGAVYAQYVINYVLAVLILVAGILFTVTFHAATGEAPLRQVLWEIIDGAGIPLTPELVLSLDNIGILAAFAVASILLLVFNILALGSIHRFAKSVYTGIQAENTKLQHINRARAWLLILGIGRGLGIVSAFSNPYAALSSAAACATCILAWVLIGKHLTNK